MFSPKMVHVIVIIKQYPHDFHATIVPCAQSRYTLSNMPPKLAATSKKKEFVWTDDEAEQLLTRAERSECDPFLLHITQWPINHKTIDGHRPQYSFKYLSSLFTRAFSLALFSKSPLRSLDSEVSVLGMRFVQIRG